MSNEASALLNKARDRIAKRRAKCLTKVQHGLSRLNVDLRKQRYAHFHLPPALCDLMAQMAERNATEADGDVSTTLNNLMDHMAGVKHWFRVWDELNEREYHLDFQRHELPHTVMLRPAVEPGAVDAWCDEQMGRQHKHDPYRFLHVDSTTHDVGAFWYTCPDKPGYSAVACFRCSGDAMLFKLTWG